MLSMDYEFLVQ